VSCRPIRRPGPSSRATDPEEAIVATQPSRLWRDVFRRRVLVAACLFGVWAAAIEARLVYLQVFRYADLQARAERQQNRTIPAPAKRGEIVDRHGRVLAYSVDTDSIYAVPPEIENPGRAADALCKALGDCPPSERSALVERLGRQRPFVFVRRQISPEAALRVTALDLDGIGFIKENRRFYPKKELASHLLGYVGVDNVGLSGIEAAYNSSIRGQDGTVLIQTDAKRKAFSRLERPPTAGANLELTIDENLQHIVERELKAGVRENRAASGVAVMIDPGSGEILALANEPTFNPNTFRTAEDAKRRNRSVQDLYEPGSTFKFVTASAAIEEKVIRKEDSVDVSAGSIRFGARQIDDVHTYGVLTFTDVIVKSSNVGAIKVGLKLGPERLGRYIARFGFGRTISPDFPAENPGIVWNPSQLNDSALASVSMGYQVGVTPLQMAAAAASIANGGTLFPPRVLRAVVRDGKRAPVKATEATRTVSAETAAELVTIMEEVVARGTATAAQIPGFTVAGKTGTAAKLVGGRYSSSEYNASFVGFAPSRKPAFVLVVVIDSPHGAGYYGGVVAAPIFRRITEASLRYLGIGPTIDPHPPVLVDRRGIAPERTVSAPALQASIIPVRGPVSTSGDVVPDLRGLSARDAVHTLTKLGMIGRLEGVGFVVGQRPEPGTPIERGAVSTLVLKRAMPVETVAGVYP
jgi:cell division protein FtsI (penicillin-binding protein 3)